MNYMDYDPYLLKERRQQMLGEVDSLRLQKRRPGIERLALLCPRSQVRTAFGAFPKPRRGFQSSPSTLGKDAK